MNSYLAELFYADYSPICYCSIIFTGSLSKCYTTYVVQQASDTLGWVEFPIGLSDSENNTIRLVKSVTFMIVNAIVIVGYQIFYTMIMCTTDDPWVDYNYSCINVCQFFRSN